MGGRRPLKAGAPRLLGNHGGAIGKAYRRVYDALEAELGPFTPLARLEAGRAAAAWVQLEAAQRALVTAQRTRSTGRGRRPSPREIERLARRAGLADGTYSAALDKLREMTRSSRNGGPPPIADLVAAQRGAPR